MDKSLLGSVAVSDHLADLATDRGPGTILADCRLAELANEDRLVELANEDRLVELANEDRLAELVSKDRLDQLLVRDVVSHGDQCQLL